MVAGIYCHHDSWKHFAFLTDTENLILSDKLKFNNQ